jgi:cysteine desulfurase/selenocysteine lyase
VPASANKFSPETWRREFAFTEDFVYLYHATLGPMPKASVEAMQASIAAHATKGSLAFFGFHAMAEDVRGRFAKLIGADRDEIAITSSCVYRKLDSTILVVKAAENWV